jgi:hypothetical protein
MPISENGELVEHKRLVEALIQELKSQGFEIINAASEGYAPCTEVEGHFPDVKAFNRKKDFVVFGLAKTCTELEDELTEEQFKFFSHRFMHGGKSSGSAVPFCIAITKGIEKQLDACLTKLKLDQKKNIFKYAFQKTTTK